MIGINLLPEEYRERRFTLPIPLRGIAWVVGGVLAVIWLLSFAAQSGTAKTLAGLKRESAELAPRVKEAEALIAEMNQTILPKKAFLDKFHSMESQWDRILNVLSDSLPENLWLASLHLARDPVFSLQIEGLARQDLDGSAVESIGTFITRSKVELEKLLAPQPGQASPKLATEMFTQQEEIKGVKVTKFMVGFKKI
jgi:Tfp pilus assembly protein PilN